MLSQHVNVAIYMELSSIYLRETRFYDKLNAELRVNTPTEFRMVFKFVC